MTTLTELIKESLDGKLSDQIQASLEVEDKEMNEATVNPRNYYDNLQIVTRDTFLIDNTKYVGDDAQLKIYKPYFMRGIDLCMMYYKKCDPHHGYNVVDWASERPMKGWKLIPSGLLNTKNYYTVIPYIINNKNPRLLVFNESRKEMRVLFANAPEFIINCINSRLLLPLKFTHMNWLCSVDGVDNLFYHDNGGIVYDIAINILKCHVQRKL